MLYAHRVFLIFAILCISSLVLTCGANTGSDGAAGAAGEAGEAGVPGPAGEDGSGAGSAPQSPSGLTAEAISPSQIDVRWVFNTGAELGFNVQRSEGDDEWETIAGTAANVTVYHDESVECEHEYSYRVLAYNDYGESQPSNEESATADYCELDAPGDMTAILDDEQEDGAQRAILLSWSEGAGELPGVPGSYEIYRKTFDGAWSATPLAAQPSDQTTYTDEDAACGQTFQYRVRAANENSVKSAFSNTATSRADACPLVDPSNLVATTDQAGSIDLSWDINDPDATGYLLQRREHEARGEWVTIADLPEGSTSYSDEGAACETAEYDYRLRAYNGDKQSAWIETLSPGSAYCVVDAPSGLYANAVGPEEIELSWINNADNATGIRIYRDEAELTTLSPDSTSYTDDTVDCETVYRYTVTAYTMNVESDFTNAEAAQTGWCPIAAPYNVTTVGDGNEVTVSWEHDQQYVESFDVQRRTEGEGLWQLLDTVSAPDTNVTDTTVACYRDYEYRVLAYNENVESAWSESATGAATGCTPTRPQPVLQSISPVSYVALSRDFLDAPPDPLYPLTITGEGIAQDTKVEVGDFLLACDTEGVGTDCQADDTGAPQNCATSCVVSLPDEIMKHADEYVVRLDTPDPVWEGSNTSAETEFFNVVAPQPVIDKIWPRGVLQQLDANNGPIPQPINVRVWGRNTLDNAQVRLGPNYGEVLSIVTDPLTGDQEIEVLVSTVGIYPNDDPYEFAMSNPPPGGGENIRPFGVNPLIENWDGVVSASLRPTRIGGPMPMVRQLFEGPSKMNTNAGLVFSGGAQWVAIRDQEGRLLKRIAAADFGSVIPYNLSDVIEVQATRRIGDIATLSGSNLEFRGGDGTFPAKNDYPMGIEPSSLATGDFNSDGATDIVTANYGSDSISIRLGNGDGTFGDKTDYPGDNPRYVAVADLNDDQALDIVVVNYSSDYLSIRFGVGDGTFGDNIDYFMADHPLSVTIEDIDGDGAPDLATTNSRKVSIRLGNGDGTFSPVTDHVFTDYPRTVVFDDLNGDGTPDITTRIGNFGKISVRLGNGNGTYGEQTDYTNDLGGIGSFAIGDLNGDGAPDMVTTTGPLGVASIRLGNGDGTFGEPSDYTMGDSPNSLGSVLIADLNGDGAPDIATANRLDDNVSIRPGNGDGSFGDKEDFAAGDGPGSMVVSDFNGDGAPDIASANYYSDNISILLGNGGSALSSRTDYEMGNGPMNVAIGDLNGDDIPDLVTANDDSDDVSVRLGNGDGTFGVNVDWEMEGESIYEEEPYSVAIGDLNGDDVPDIATANYESWTVSIRFGNGDGTFSAETVNDMGFNPYSIMIVDLNDDDNNDIVTAGAAVTISLGNGDGTFADQIYYMMGTGPFCLAIGDLDGDETPDIATANLDGDASVRIGNGDGTFGEQTDYAMGSEPYSIAVADLNGDDALDIVTANNGDYNVSIRFGNGDGTFGDNTEFLMGDHPKSVSVGDFNGDGLPDIATANEFGDTVSIRVGRGGGIFGPKTDFAMGNTPYSLAIADLNDDGQLDLVTANYNDDNVSVRLMGDIPGTWRQELTDSFSDDPDQPWLPKYAPVGFTNLDIHQAAQTVTKVGVRVMLEWTTQPAGTVGLGLVAPDGQMVDLGSHSDFTAWPDDENPTSWRLNKTFREYDFNGETGIAGLVDLHGLQPTDYWTLSIDNQTGAPAEVKNFTVITDGHF